ncbi:protein-tyrosine phosphatase [Xanthomarina spongicola]|uniref:protein-tyrosine-phosphatase n=2 Tax=Xanthomarina spongicola TaxID=570520 RepID=A0A316E9C7_9FLAO|nr:protein-tyrosine phosphatase [Xanthomarina spongicola]
MTRETNMTKILIVCLGNICRSPLAEGILKSKLPSEEFIVDSAGTGDYHIGSTPDNRSIKVAKKYGLDISNQRGRQFTELDFIKFDIIYVMDSSNYENVIRLARNENDKNKVKMILNEIYPNQNYDVPDPYTGGIQGFESTFKMLDEACIEIAKTLLK